METEMSDRGAPIVPPLAEADVLPERVKLPATIGIECLVAPMAMVGLLVLFIGLTLGPGRKSLGVVAEETALFIGFGIGGAILVIAALLWLLVDNHYVLDRSSRRILLHKGIRFSGIELPCWEKQDITAIGLNCTQVRHKGHQVGWSYTPVLLIRDSSMILLAALRTNMKCAKLPDYNRRTRLWAAALQCHWVECPPHCEFCAADRLALIAPARKLNRTAP